MNHARPVRPHTCPVVGDAYFTTVVADGPQATFRCIVLAVDRERHAALIAWEKAQTNEAHTSWIECDELRTKP